MRNANIVLALSVVGCGQVSSKAPDAGAGSDAEAADAGTDAVAARCDPTKDFAAPTLVANINTSGEERFFSLTRDERIGFVSSLDQLSVTTRASTNDPFGTPSQAETAALDAAAGTENSASVDADGLAVYFGRDLSSADHRIFVATRASAHDALPAGDEVFVDGVGLDPGALAPTLSDDGATLYWIEGNTAIVHAATRASAIEFTHDRPVSTAFLFTAPVLSSNELQMFYMPSNDSHVFLSTRASKTDVFPPGVAVASVNSTGQDTPVFLTRDGCVLYLASNRPGGLGASDIWEAHRPR